MFRTARPLFLTLLGLAVFGLSLPAAADPAPAEAAAAVERTDERSPAPRLTTAERWRGRPYLRSSSRQRERAALPVVSPTEGRPALLMAREDEELLRQRALDKPLPIRNPALVGAIPAFRGIEADPIRRLSLDQQLPYQGAGFGPAF